MLLEYGKSPPGHFVLACTNFSRHRDGCSRQCGPPFECFGTRSLVATAIESSGSASLVRVGNNYFSRPHFRWAVPSEYGGATVVAGQFNTWVRWVGATSSG